MRPVLLALLFAPAAFAQMTMSPDRWAQAACLSDECEGDSVVLEFESGMRFNGTIRDGLPTGEGMLSRNDTTFYRGDFNAGTPAHIAEMNLGRNGDSACTVNGLIQDGDVSFGTLRCEHDFFQTGLYIGELKNMQPHGHGSMSWEFGWMYTGDWRDGARHGEGELVAPLLVYRGEFANDRPHGQGTQVKSDGRTYVGGWAEGVPSGQGVLTWAVGSTRLGPMRGAVRLEGEFSGQGPAHGLLTWADGRTFEGTFEGRSPMPVEGVLTSANGVSRSVRFDEGEWEFVTTD